jgi:hypothetical protein
MTLSEAAVALAVAGGYAVWAYNHPYHDCPRCRGSGRNRGSTGRRRGKCRRCKGAREVKTAGSQMLHRMVRGAVRYRKDKGKER